MRLWLSDRPGALGAVATEIGRAGGDLIGIDILERGNGRVIDELTIDLSSEEEVPRLLEAVGSVEGVDVEDVRKVIGGLPHPLIDALEVAAEFLSQRSIDSLFTSLVEGVSSAFSAWSAVVDPEGPVVLSATNDAPSGAWLEAFVTGARSAHHGPKVKGLASDVAWASLEVSGLALLAGRSGRPFRARERRQLATLGRIADHRWRELVLREGLRAHPARS